MTRERNNTLSGGMILAPATESQLEVWMSCLLGGDDANRAYNFSVSLDLKGKLDRAALEKSIQTLVSRHESLRSVISEDGTGVKIYEHNQPTFRYEDLSRKDEKDTVLENFVRTDVNNPFDLSRGPLYKLSLIKLAENHHILLCTFHHIIVDGWSMALFMEELGVVYSATVAKKEIDLPTPVSFQQYAEQQRTFVQSEEYRQTELFWLNQFRDQVPVLEMPADFPRPSVRTNKSKRSDFVLDDTLAEDILKLANKLKCGLSITMRAAFEILLYRITAQNDIVLGLPVAGQPVTGNDRLISHCVNLLPLRSRLNKQQTFKDYATERKFATLDAYDHQQFTFGTLLKKLNIPRDHSRVPLVSVVFGVDTGIAENIHFEGLEYQLLTNKREYENFEMFINVTNEGGPLTLQWTYNTQLFSAQTIQLLMSRYRELLQNIVSKPEIAVSELMPAELGDLREKLARWNATSATYPENSTVMQLVAQSASYYPKKTAIRFGGEKLSYQSLIEEVDTRTSNLQLQGIEPGDVVAVAVDRSTEMVLQLLSVMKAGAAYVPVDPGYPLSRIRYMLDDSGAKAVITSRKYKDQFRTVRAKELYIEDIAVPDETTLRPVTRKGTDLAYIMYTSGSTGVPKGIAIEHRSLTNFLCSMQKSPGINADDTFLAVTTISFDISGLELYLPLISGAELLLADTDATRDGRELLDILRRERVTMMQATPSTWRMMLEFGWNEKLNLKALCGGEAFPRDLASDLLRQCREVWNMYGPTETTIWSSIKKIGGASEGITVGRPINNTQIYILDEDLKLVPQGNVGEICIAGDGLARGYWNKRELSEAVFVENPLEEGGRLYRTGDLGKFSPEGEIICLGRKDNQIKIRGFRIEPGAIESKLTAIGQIKEAIVIGREDRPGDQRLVAYVAVAQELSDESKHIGEWKVALGTSLPHYMIPADFVILKNMPLLPNGKVDRKSLPAPTEHYRKTLAGSTGEDGNIEGAPETELENLIRSIWQEYLNLENIGLDENFFELGGHSMIAVRVMGKIEKETGQRLPLASLFEHSTVRGIASLLDSGPAAIKWDSLVAIKPSGSKMPLYIVHGAGLNVLPFDNLAKNMDPEQPVYGLQAKGLNGIDEPLEKIEDMAAYYIEEILQQNPTGPYALAGFSFGGLIAFDMAKQMKTMGKEVRVLAIFDTNVSQSDRFDSLPKKWFKRTKFLINQILYSFKLLADDPWRTIQYKSQSIRRMTVSLYWKYRYGENNDRQGFYGYSHAVDMKNIQAVDRYVLTPYNGVIDLFRAKKRLFFINDFTWLGWKPYAMKGIRIHEIPGEHNYIFDHPNVEEFAEVLQKCLDENTVR